MIKTQSESKKWAITALAILNDKYWISGSQDGQVKVWNEKNNFLSRFEANSAVTSLCVGSGGQIYIGCEDGTLHQWHPSLKVVIPLDDESLLKPFRIDGHLVSKLKDGEGQFDMIARGGGGTVYKGLYKDKRVAIKESQDNDNLMVEIKVMAQMHDYPTILTLEGLVQEKGKLQLVMELMSQGSLSSFLKKKGNISWEERWVLMMDIVYGLLCLHANNIVHRDIKTDNILINNNRARISDFGTARKNIKTQTTQITGTLGYWDPWFVTSEGENDRYTEKSDIYSLGNVLWAMLNEIYQEPWNDIQNLRDYKQRLVENNEKLPISDKAPPTFKTFLLKLWEKQRNKRPNMTTVFEKVSISREEFQKNDPNFLSKTFSKTDDGRKTLMVTTSNRAKSQRTKMSVLSVVKEDKGPYNMFLTMDKATLKLYLLATDQNLVSAQYELGLCYEKGKGVNKDPTIAVNWYRKAAEQGHAPSQNALGSCYKKGFGVTQDKQEALKWFQKAAEHDLADAKKNLGLCYLNGSGVTKNEKEALKWLLQVDDRLDASTKFKVALCYQNGIGTDKDEKEAIQWFQRASDKGHAEASLNLSVCYQNGRGVDKDEKAAVTWFKKATEQGYIEPQNALISEKKTQGMHKVEEQEEIEFEKVGGSNFYNRIQALMNKLTDDGFLAKNLEVYIEPEKTEYGDIIFRTFEIKHYDTKLQEFDGWWFSNHIVVTIKNKETGKPLAKMKGDVSPGAGQTSEEEFNNPDINDDVLEAWGQARDEMFNYCDAYEASFSNKLDDANIQALYNFLKKAAGLSSKKDNLNRVQRALLINNKIISLPEKIYRLIVDKQGKRLWRPVKLEDDKAIDFNETYRTADEYKPYIVLETDIEMSVLAYSSLDKFKECCGGNYVNLNKFLNFLKRDNKIRFSRFKEIKSKYHLIDREGKVTPGYKKFIKRHQILMKMEQNSFSFNDLEYQDYQDLKEYIDSKKKHDEMTVKLRADKDQISSLQKLPNLAKNDLPDDEDSPIHQYIQSKNLELDETIDFKQQLLISIRNDMKQQNNLLTKLSSEIATQEKELAKVKRKIYDDMHSYLYEVDILSEIETSLMHRLKLLKSLSFESTTQQMQESLSNTEIRTEAIYKHKIEIESINAKLDELKKYNAKLEL